MITIYRMKLFISESRLTDAFINSLKNEPALDLGHAILSPTKTYAPLIKNLLENNFDKINGLIHCSGGGQTKCLK